MSNDLKAVAEGYRLGLMAGIDTVDAVVEWADSVIESEARPHSSIIEVALARDQPANRMIGLLEQIPGDVDDSEVLRAQMRRLLSCLEADPHSAEDVARRLYRLATAGPWPSEVFGDEAYWLEDTFEFVRQGHYRGTYDDAVNDLRAYFNRNIR
jgi:hypothetical protein